MVYLKALSFRDSSMNLVTILPARRPGFDSRQSYVFIFSPPLPDRFWGPPCVPGTLSLGVKRPGRESDQLLPSYAEVKYKGKGKVCFN
jgi:hypothetical protein